MYTDRFLSHQEKEDFIFRNGWKVYHQSDSRRWYVKKEWSKINREWTGHPDHAPYAWQSCTLKEAYEFEMEEEYDRVTELLKQAKRIISQKEDEVSKGWMEQYLTWVKI